MHVADEALVISRQHAEIVLKPETDREPRDVRCKAEHIEPHTLGQFGDELSEGLAVADALEDIADLARLSGFVNAGKHRAESGFSHLRCGRVGRIRPENGRSIADL